MTYICNKVSKTRVARKVCSLGVSVMVGSMALFTSCSDSFLDKVPDERSEISTIDHVIQLLNTSYPYPNYGWVAELSSDNMIDNNAPHLPASPYTEQIVTHYKLAAYDRMDDELFAFETAKSSNSWDSPYWIWEGFYSSIASANNALEAIERIKAENGGQTTPKMRAAEAEARLLRAYCHFILVNIFSQAYKDEQASKADVGIPYVTVPETVVRIDYDRSNVADTYSRIQEDLEAGLANISDINYTKPKWHFNINAAHAFAARFYLFKRDYAKVIEHANAVLGTGTLANGDPKLISYSSFYGLNLVKDIARIWQGPDQNNNLMLLSTSSIAHRRLLGYRYSTNGQPAREIFYHHNTALWGEWALNPTALVSYIRGNNDYGYGNYKTAEEFEYSDKIALTGVPHVIRREFTATLLLLERAEAKAMLGDYDGAAQDLVSFDQSYTSYSDSDMRAYFTNDRMQHLTKEIIQRWFATDRSDDTRNGNFNCYDNWDFTKNMSSDFVVPAEAVPYMNCINYFRRMETWGEGWRFFDLKRFGIEYSHFVGLENTEYKLRWNDPRRAIEVPLDAQTAGLEASRPVAEEQLPVLNPSDYVVKK